VTSSDINVILVKLEHLEAMMSSIHEEVKRTNGRVTELEMDHAKWDGVAESKSYADGDCLRVLLVVACACCCCLVCYSGYLLRRLLWRIKMVRLI
jgi:hypothetical protein